MPTPSLILVPARFKTGKLYTPVATTSGGVVLGASGDFNVTRATTATRVNASGFIESVASGIPRLDYYTSGGTAGCPALLVEPSAQNLVVQSQNWLASGWRSDATGFTITITGTTGTLDPLGTNTANAISPTSGSAIHLKVGNDGSLSFTSGTIYTESAFFKQGTGNAGRYVQLTFPLPQFTQVGYANFDLQLGTVAVVSGTTADSNRAASIENYGNGWYRCRLTATCNSTGTNNGFSAVLLIASGSTRAPSFAGTVTDVLYGWGAQVETGSIATSYIPTTAAPVTRNADVITLSGAVSGCIGQTEGTIYAEVDIQFNNRNADIIGLDSGSSANGFYLIIRSSSVIELRIRQNSINALIFQRTGAYPVGINKIAVSYKNGDFAISLNGTTTQVDTSTITMPSVAITRASVVPSINFTLDQSVRVRAAALYTTRLTNAELAALTTL